MSLAMTGRPVAYASAITMGKPSYHSDGTIRARASFMRRTTSSFGPMTEPFDCVRPDRDCLPQGPIAYDLERDRPPESLPRAQHGTDPLLRRQAARVQQEVAGVLADARIGIDEVRFDDDPIAWQAARHQLLASEL